MLSPEENELLTRTGAGTPMGETMRRYWIPALVSWELPEPDCPPVRVKLLGEGLVAFRDTHGRIGLLSLLCFIGPAPRAICARARGTGAVGHDRIHQSDRCGGAAVRHGREKGLFQKRRCQRGHRDMQNAVVVNGVLTKIFGLRRNHRQFYWRRAGRFTRPHRHVAHGRFGSRAGFECEHQANRGSQRENHRHQQFRRRLPWEENLDGKDRRHYAHRCRRARPREICAIFP